MAEEVRFQATSLEEANLHEEAARQLQFEIELRERIAAAFPDKFHYRVQLANALIRRGQFFKRTSDAERAMVSLKFAEEILLAIVKQDPNDLAAKKALADAQKELSEPGAEPSPS